MADSWNMLSNSEEATFSNEDRNTIRIINNHIYSVSILCVDYTTYDMCHGQDTMNPRMHCDVMVVSQEAEDDPYWYAQVLGVFHMDILHVGPLASNCSVQHMEFLWVHWFGIKLGYRSDFRFGHLLKVYCSKVQLPRPEKTMDLTGL